MPTLPRTKDSPQPASVHRELDDVLDACAQLAARHQSPPEFYSELSKQITPALAASGFAGWIHESPSRMSLCAASGSLLDPPAPLRRNVEELATGESRAEPRSIQVEQGTLVLVTVSPARWMNASWIDSSPSASRSWATITVLLPRDMAPSSLRLAEEFIGHIADLASEFHARCSLARSAGERDELVKLIDLARASGKTLDLSHTATVIANDGRRLLDCDRLSVLRPRGSSAQLLATSGLSQFDRRSRAVRELEKLASLCLRWQSPVVFGETVEDTPPELTEPLQQYVEVSNTRSLVAVPVQLDGESGACGLLVVENFGGNSAAVDPHSVQELAAVVAPSLHAAAEFKGLPFSGLLRKLRISEPKRALARSVTIASAVAVVAAVLMLVQRPLVVRAPGELVPVEQSHIFAPHNGLVESIAITHGSDVKQGDILVVLRSPELELERTRLAGERQTLESQLSAIEATRLALTAGEGGSLELYRLSAEESTLKQKLASLNNSQQQLDADLAELTIRSPRAGRVVTWQVEQQLTGRPVERGQQLMQVANTTAGWHLEFAVPDRQVGDVQQAIANDQLNVRYQLAAADTQYQSAEIVRLSNRADDQVDSMGNTTTTVALLATPHNAADGEALDSAGLRPGGQVRGRIECGQRSLGYILTRGLVRTIREWWML